nr:Hpt domain-containing protein [endosymbiont of Lamellibrachia barhami]
MNWVKAEIDETLRQARQALEERIEGEGDASSLEVCADRLHQISGVLQMVQAYGPGMLAEEMEQVARAMYSGKVRQIDDAAEALMLALIQLPDYLEKLQAGDSDIPFIVLPLLNDLRAVREAPLLSEAALFNPDLDDVQVAGRITGEPNEDLPALARRSRHKFHLGLLNWYRKLNVEKGWGYLQDVVDELERSAGTEQVHRLMWVAGALIQGLREFTIDSGIAVKQLFGKLDRQLKHIVDEGESSLVNDPPKDLLKNLLYYVARADSGSPRILEVKEAYHLNEVLPSEADLVLGRQGLTGANEELAESVRDAIHIELTHVKDVLDLFMRGEQFQPGALAKMETPLRKLGDTLGMIGQGALRTRLIRQADRVHSIVERETQPEEFELMEMAGDLLFVESSLSNIHSGKAPVDHVVDDGGWGQDLPQGEYESLVRQTVREAKVDIAKAKEAIISYTETAHDASVLEDVYDEFHRVYGALNLLGLVEPARILGLTADFIRARLIEDGQIPERQQLNSLADVISSIEYFLESLIDGAGDRNEIVSIARAALAGLLETRGALPSEKTEVVSDVPAPVVPLPVSPEINPAEESETEEAVPGEALEAPSLVDVSSRQVEQADIEASTQEIPIPSADKPALEDIDSEILEIFIEEAREELEVIQEYLPRWQQNHDDKDALITFRRSFHTLKGSGRLVGAKIIGELAWSVENMINRVIDETIEVTPEIFDLLDTVQNIMPELIDCQERSVLPAVDVDAVINRIFALSEGRAAKSATAKTEEVEPLPEQGEESTPSEHYPSAEEEILVDTDLLEVAGFAASEDTDSTEPVVESPALDQIDEALAHLDTGDEVAGYEVAIEESVVDASLEAEAEAEAEAEVQKEELSAADLEIELDTELLEIFEAESAAHLKTLDKFVTRAKAKAEGIPLTEKVSRAFHTLHGSAHMAGVTSIAGLSKALEYYVNSLMSHHQVTNEGVVAFIDDGASLVRGLLAWLLDHNLQEPETEDFLHRLDHAHELLEKEEGREETSEAQQDAQMEDDVQEAEISETIELEPVSAKGVEEDIAAEAGREDISLPFMQEEPLFEVGEDPELIEIFVEEARELLESIESTYQQWMGDSQNDTLIDDIQRTLHTLKGSARLAGILPVGDLSHALETVFTGVADRQLSASESVTDLTRQALDRLATQVDEVGSIGRVHQPQNLIAGLEGLLSEMGLAEVDGGRALPATEEAEAPPPSIEERAAPQPDEAEPLQESVSPADDVWKKAFSLFKGETDVESQADESGSIFRPARDQVRVSSTLMDRMVNNAGEISIYRTRLEQQNSVLGFNLTELEQTVARLHEQLRKLEIETEAQILYRWERDDYEKDDVDKAAFDPLELDRFSNMQQLSRALIETVSDLDSIYHLMDDLQRETDTLLLQQSRISTDLQDGLLRTRMVPFAQLLPRLQRVVRQTADQLGKKARLDSFGTDGEMDRSILNRMIPALEHLLRNAVSHGIESLSERAQAEKGEQGVVSLYMAREASDIVLTISDDGRGLDIDAIKAKAIDHGLIVQDAEISDDDLMQCVLMPGFTTADEVTQIAGRGVGLDVVSSEVKQLGGTLGIDSQPGRGTSFTIRLPLTLAITDALLVRIGEEVYAIPHGSVEGVVRISHEELSACYAGEQVGYSYAGRSYKVENMGQLMMAGAPDLHESAKWFPILLVHTGEHQVALQVDGLLGTRQIVVKPLGKQVSSVPWITGGTILADGRVALILDVGTLVRLGAAHALAVPDADKGAEAGAEKERLRVLVVDDSITVRKVTTRLLERHEMDVVTAKDGVDAVALLQEQVPDIMLLDIEMPRMDGFELARHMRNSADYKKVPIIMISSRVGEKHRQRAFDLGVKRCLGKPYQESDLLENINEVLAEGSA